MITATTHLDNFQLVSQFAALYGGELFLKDGWHIVKLSGQDTRIKKLFHALEYIDIRGEFARYVEANELRYTYQSLKAFLNIQKDLTLCYVIKVRNADNYFSTFIGTEPRFTTHKYLAEKWRYEISAKFVCERLNRLAEARSRYEVLSVKIGA